MSIVMTVEARLIHAGNSLTICTTLPSIPIE